MTKKNVSQQYDELLQRFRSAGQEHVFAYFAHLSDGGKQQLLEQAAQIDLAELERLYQDLSSGSGTGIHPEQLQPAPYIVHPRHGGDSQEWQKAARIGDTVIRAGKIAAFTVAGGQGTRLGFDGPKGTFAATPVRKASLFQVFAEKIQASGRKYAVSIPWLIMTSKQNHQQTHEFFVANDWFGLNPRDVILFSQGWMPAVDFNGKIILEAPDSIAMSPDGHGGALRAIVRSKALERLQELGVETISYFQVDNPLVHCIDPAFIGFHYQLESQLSSKMVPKAYPEEKVGHFCLRDGVLHVVEYSDMPQELMHASDESGELKYKAGSIAIHLLAVDLVLSLGGSRGQSLPFHRAEKKVPFVDSSGSTQTPDQPNGIKFEQFVFDAIPLASESIVVETLREDDFSPIKNAQGNDSPQTCRKDQLILFARWFAAVGIDLPLDSEGVPLWNVEVAPTFAQTEEEFIAAWNALHDKPEVAEGLVLTS